MRKVEKLPEGRQDDAANVLLTMLENDASSYRLSDAQLVEVELAMAETKAGKFASKKQVAEILERPWA